MTLMLRKISAYAFYGKMCRIDSAPQSLIWGVISRVMRLYFHEPKASENIAYVWNNSPYSTLRCVISDLLHTSHTPCTIHASQARLSHAIQLHAFTRMCIWSEK